MDTNLHEWNFMGKLLDGVEVEWKALGEVGEFIRGSGIQKSDFIDSGDGCIHYGQIHTHYGTWATETKWRAPQKLIHLL
jgi:type I restriction enzyme S subunit